MCLETLLPLVWMYAQNFSFFFENTDFCIFTEHKTLPHTSLRCGMPQATLEKADWVCPGFGFCKVTFPALGAQALALSGPKWDKAVMCRDELPVTKRVWWRQTT